MIGNAGGDQRVGQLQQQGRRSPQDALPPHPPHFGAWAEQSRIAGSSLLELREVETDSPTQGHGSGQASAATRTLTPPSPATSRRKA